MFKEILQIKPKLSTHDLNSMERSLSKRFGKVAKKFGRGLGSVLKGGGLIAAIGALVGTLLNPLKETQDAIDRTLALSDTVVTNAKQFGTTAGKLFRLQALASSTGLDAAGLSMLMGKFQVAVSRNAQNPEVMKSVSNYVGEKDTASAFFEFIQALQKMNKSDQVFVQQEIFGEKQILKMADFLQQDFGRLTKQLGGPTSGQLEPQLQKLGALNDFKDLLTAKRGLNDAFTKGDLINRGMVESQDAMARKELEKENANIKGYKDLASISNAMADLSTRFRELTVTITSAVTRFYKLEETFQKMGTSPVWRGILRFIKAE